MNAPANAAELPVRPARQMTAAELAGYRRELEHAIAYFDQQDPVPPARADLQARLDTITGQAAPHRRRPCVSTTSPASSAQYPRRS